MGLVRVDDRHWRIQFGPLSIGLLDDHLGRVISTPTKVLPMCPFLHAKVFFRGDGGWMGR